MKRSVSFLKARNAFAFHNRAGNLSPLSIDWYDKRLALLETYLCKAHQTTPEAFEVDSITVDDLRGFMAFLQDKETKWDDHAHRKPKKEGLAPVTIRGYRRALSAFLNWANRENLISSKPHENLERTKLPRIIKENLSEEEIRKLLKATQEHTDPVLCARDKALVLFLLDTGVRASELCGMTLPDIDATWQRVKIHGKGMRDRYVPISAPTRAALYQYVMFMRPNDVDRLNRVFLTDTGRAMERYVLADILRSLGERAKVGGVHPHRFRRTAGTMFYENSHGNLFRTQELLGHSSPMTTRGYVGTSSKDLEEIHADASPVTNWGLK